MGYEEFLQESFKKKPVLGKDVFIADGVRLVGHVTIGEGSSIWFNSVLRGDINRVSIGSFTNIQDGSICHVANEHACLIGSFNTIGHNVILHGCTVGDENLVGMGAILMNGVRVGNQCIIGAGALLTEGLEVPDGSLVYGSPAKIVSKIGEKERGEIRKWAEKYHKIASHYLERTKSAS
ncbi:MAG: gamma carbonic anhydrase family protein [Verrucomicrobiae bacterium]|nr:gamma carbonic anhydrase family protein [Verrucomicrobiae bacterium]